MNEMQKRLAKRLLAEKKRQNKTAGRARAEVAKQMRVTVGQLMSIDFDSLTLADCDVIKHPTDGGSFETSTGS